MISKIFLFFKIIFQQTLPFTSFVLMKCVGIPRQFSGIWRNYRDYSSLQICFQALRKFPAISETGKIIHHSIHYCIRLLIASASDRRGPRRRWPAQALGRNHREARGQAHRAVEPSVLSLLLKSVLNVFFSLQVSTCYLPCITIKIVWFTSKSCTD